MSRFSVRRLAHGSFCAVLAGLTASVLIGCGQNAQLTPTATSSSTGVGVTPALTLPPGTISTTANPQVAAYNLNLPAAGSVVVNFGTTTTYGHQTSVTAAAAGPVSILVAGMLPQTAYHMQATVQFAAGGSAQDVDQTFTTGAPELVVPLNATTTPGTFPQPGLEELTLLGSGSQGSGLVVTDLNANILWSYLVPASDQGQIQGAQQLSNGHFLVTIGQGSSAAIVSGTPAGSTQALREIDLAGNTVHQLNLSTLNSTLQAAGYNITLTQFHHDVHELPNGHILALSNTVKAFTDLPGYPGVTNVLADVIIDLDPTLKPVWVWNEFDHLDVNRHPFMFPDLTHTNTVLYSPTDGNLIVSMRHQNWVVKVDYRNGQGTGAILWHLGFQGDFKLINGTDPSDWSYAQHFPSLFSSNSAGVFRLGMMDNGDDRAFPDGVVCDNAGTPPCYYSSVPVYQIDETAMTATVVFHQILPPNLYSFFGGNTDLLGNGDIEYDLAASIQPTGSDIFEVTPDPANPQTVWHMQSPSEYAYRGYRIPSLYPGVQY